MSKMQEKEFGRNTFSKISAYTHIFIISGPMDFFLDFGIFVNVENHTFQSLDNAHLGKVSSGMLVH